MQFSGVGRLPSLPRQHPCPSSRQPRNPSSLRGLVPECFIITIEICCRILYNCVDHLCHGHNGGYCYDVIISRVLVIMFIVIKTVDLQQGEADR